MNFLLGCFGVLIGAMFLVAFTIRILPTGDPLGNLPIFVEDIFRLEVDDVDNIRQRSNSNKSPDDPSDLRSLQINSTKDLRPSDWICGDFVLEGYETWSKGAENARKARDEATNNTVTPDMQWPTFWSWNSPVYTNTRIRTDFFTGMFLKSVDSTIAVYGTEFDVAEVVDLENGKFADVALDQIFLVKGRGYEGLYQNQILEKTVSVSEIRTCDDITIFRLKIR